MCQKNRIEKLGFKNLKKIGIGSALALFLLCKLPLILAFIGITVLGSSLGELSSYTPLVLLALTVVASGIAFLIYNRFFRKTVVQHDT